MTDTDDTDDTAEKASSEGLEERMAALEESIVTLEERNEELQDENERIKAELEDQSGPGLSGMTRRGALGVLGGGALLGAAGSASAKPGKGKGGPPFADEDHEHSEYAGNSHDHSGEYGTSNVLGEAAPVESITAQRFHATSSLQAPRDGVVDRDIVSTSPIQIWVDPDGDDSAPGTQDKPVASLQEALNRLPYIVAHPTDIVLTSGTAENPTVHDTGGGVIAAGIHTTVYSGRQEGRDVFEDEDNPGSTLNVGIRSESGNAEDTIVRAKRFLSFSFVGNSGLNVGLANLTLEASVQNYGGILGIIECVLTGGSQKEHALGGYYGHIQVTLGKITAPVVSKNGSGATVGLNAVTIDPGVQTSSTGEQALLAAPDDSPSVASHGDEDGLLDRYQSGATLYVKKGNIKVPYFGEGAIGTIITLDDIHHPQAPEGIIQKIEEGGGREEPTPIEKDGK